MKKVNLNVTVTHHANPFIMNGPQKIELRPYTDYRCRGCDRAFNGMRGVTAHQTVKFGTMACRPIYVNQEA